ncbi:DUF2273 domain-containing protein [Peptococcaceae bacterium 1198_IL3148]
MDFRRILQEILENHRGKTLGVLLGLIFGWFAISYGFFKAVFVSICIIVGYIIGKRVDEIGDVKKVFNRLFGQR